MITGVHDVGWSVRVCQRAHPAAGSGGPSAAVLYLQ